MKQTAVEWQFEQLFNSFEKFNNGECTFNDYLKRNLEIREQAKEMEKQQQGYSEEDMKELIIKIPKGYMNVGISTSNKLIADTNDSSNWDEIYFPLPKGEWNIENIDIQTNIIKLIKNK